MVANISNRHSPDFVAMFDWEREWGGDAHDHEHGRYDDAAWALG